MKRAPMHLQPATRRWVNSVLRDWNLEPHHVHLLVLAGEAWDRCGQAREAVARDGLVVTDKGGALRPHPAVNIERDARLAFARLLRELRLDDVAPPEDVRLPRPAGGAPILYRRGG